MPRTLILACLLLGGCVEGVTQVAGTGSVYTTRCSAVMETKGDEYFAKCTPPSCASRYTEGPVNQVVVAVDPGKKVVGYAERVCIQDLSNAAALFQARVEEAEKQHREEEKAGSKAKTPAPAPESTKP